MISCPRISCTDDCRLTGVQKRQASLVTDKVSDTCAVAEGVNPQQPLSSGERSSLERRALVRLQHQTLPNTARWRRLPLFIRLKGDRARAEPQPLVATRLARPR